MLGVRLRVLAPVLVTALLAGCASSPLSTSAGTAQAPGDAAGTSSAAADGGSSGAAGGGAVAPSVAGASGPSPAAGQGGAVVGGDGGTSAVTARTLDAAEFFTNVRNAGLAKQTVAISMTGDGGLRAQGLIRYGSTLAMSLTMTNQGKRIRFLLLGPTAYLDAGQKVGGRTWVRLDEKAGGAGASLLANLRQQTNLAPAAAALRGVRVSGRAGLAVGGVPTVTYTVKMSSKQLVAALPADLRSVLAPELAGATSVSTYAVDGDWLPRRVVVVTTTKGKPATTTVTYSKWGAPVTIAAPPASDVATLPAG